MMKLVLCILLLISLCVVNQPVNNASLSYSTEFESENYREIEDVVMNDIPQNCCDPKMIIPGNPDIDPKIIIQGPDVDNGIMIPVETAIISNPTMD